MLMLLFLLCATVGPQCWPKYSEPEIGRSDRNDGEVLSFRNELTNGEDPPPRTRLRHGGTVEGFYMKSCGGKPFSAYEGIPYAEPPIGKNQFQPPAPKFPWKGTFLATKPSSPCLQIETTLMYTLIGSEDCLTLNVYVPKLDFGEKIELLPVLIFIHGGSYLFGSGFDYGPSYWLNQKIILVNFNYRLGILGFMSTGDEVVPGNNGLKDQALVLKWVHENIQAFGGDPGQVTLSGHSAGGASVQFHMMSWTRRYFQRAISFSGTAFNSWAMSSRERSMSMLYKLAKRLRCSPMDPSRNNSIELLKCFRNRNPAFVVSNQVHLLEWGPAPFVLFTPVVEPEGQGAILTASPQTIYDRKDVAEIPWIATYTKEEGYFFLELVYMTLKIGELRRDWWRLAPYLLDYEGHSRKDEIRKKLTQFYFHGNYSLPSNHIISKMITSRFFVQEIEEAKRAHFALAPTYSFIFDFKGKYNIGNTIGFRSNEWGVGHAEDQFYLFNSSRYYQGFKRSDRAETKISQIMIQLLANFVSTGKPFYEDKEVKGQEFWRPVPEYLSISNNGVESKLRNPFTEELNFWNQIDLTYRRSFSLTKTKGQVLKLTAGQNKIKN